MQQPASFQHGRPFSWCLSRLTTQHYITTEICFYSISFIMTSVKIFDYQDIRIIRRKSRLTVKKHGSTYWATQVSHILGLLKGIQFYHKLDTEGNNRSTQSESLGVFYLRFCAFYLNLSKKTCAAKSSKSESWRIFDRGASYIRCKRVVQR